jgi:hypothetical protein
VHCIEIYNNFVDVILGTNREVSAAGEINFFNSSSEGDVSFFICPGENSQKLKFKNERKLSLKDKKLKQLKRS